MKKLLFILFVFISVVASSQIPQHMMHVLASQDVSGTTLKTDLVSVWEFNETSGTDAFDAHGSNDGINNGATVNQTGKLDKAYDYVHANEDYVYISDDPSLSFGDGTTDSPFSISAWIKWDNLTNRNAIAGKASSAGNSEWIFFCFDTDGRLSFQIHDTGGPFRIGKNQTTGSISAGTWYHVCGTYDGNSSDTGIKLYIDGSAIAMTTNNSDTYVAMHDYTIDLNIGAYWVDDASLDRYSDGLIDQVAIWGKELTTDEITTLYNSGDGLAYTNW